MALKSWLLGLALVPAFLDAQVRPAGGARASADSAAIARLEQRIEDAMVSRDANFLDSVYAPTFRFKHSTGTVETRESRMASVRRPVPPNAPGRFIARVVDSLEVEVHGPMALTTGRIHVRRDGGEPRWQNYTIRYARMYARNAAGRWQLVTHHSTGDSQGPPGAVASIDREFLNSGKVLPTTLPFSEAVRVGNTLYLSGQVGIVPGTMALVPGGMPAEARQTMENIRASLAANGYLMSDIIKCTVMLADMADWPAFNEIYRTFFTPPFPARSALGANGLALGARVEVECIATRAR